MRRPYLLLLVAFVCLIPSAALAAVVASVGTLAGSPGVTGSADGAGSAARFFRPEGIAISGDGSFALAADTENNTIRRIVLATGAVTTLAGSPGAPGGADGVGPAARLFHPEGVALAGACPFALVADTDNHTIRRIDLATRMVTTLAGGSGTPGSADGSGTTARFAYPSGVALSDDCTFALIADTQNDTIRRIDTATGVVTTLAGAPDLPGSIDNTGREARFSLPRGVAISRAAGIALVADTGNHTIRRIVLATAAVTTLAGFPGVRGVADGVGAVARFNFPRNVAISPDGSVALVADLASSTIRGIAIASRSVTTIAGLPGARGSADGLGNNARFNAPSGVALWPAAGVALVADTGNSTIRRTSAVTLARDTYLPLARN